MGILAFLAGCAHGAGSGTARGPHVVKGSEDFALRLTPREADGLYRPELRLALEVQGAREAPVWVRVEKDGFVLGQKRLAAGVATLGDPGILLEGSLGEGWYKVVVEEVLGSRRYPFAWYTLPIGPLESTGGRILAIHPSYYRKHADLREGVLRMVVSAPLEQPATELVTEWVYEGRIVGEVARRWDLPSLWILQPLWFPLRVQMRAPYQLVDGRWEVLLFRDGVYEMRCPFEIRGGRTPARLECNRDEVPLSAEAHRRALKHESVLRDGERAQQVRALVRSPEVRRALVTQDARLGELVRRFGGAQASLPAQP